MAYKPTPKRIFYDPHQVPVKVREQVKGQIASGEHVIHDDFYPGEGRKPRSEFLVYLIGRREPITFRMKDGQWQRATDHVPEDTEALPRTGAPKDRHRRASIKKPCYLSEQDLDWLLALLQVYGDPLALRRPFDEARRLIVDEAERNREMAGRLRATAAIASTEGTPPARTFKMWTCKGCGELNGHDLQTCTKCKGPRKRKAPPKPPAVPNLNAVLEDLIHDSSGAQDCAGSSSGDVDSSAGVDPRPANEV